MIRSPEWGRGGDTLLRRGARVHEQGGHREEGEPVGGEGQRNVRFKALDGADRKGLSEEGGQRLRTHGLGQNKATAADSLTRAV